MSTTEDFGALTPVPLMQISTGFWAFKTLAAANELDVFTRLAGGAEMTAAELARELAIEQRPAEMLLTGCASLGLLERGDHGYRNTPLSEGFLVRGTPYYFGGVVTMFDTRLYPGWAKLTEAIRTNRPTTSDPERERSMFRARGSGAAGHVLGGDALLVELHRTHARRRYRSRRGDTAARRGRRFGRLRHRVVPAIPVAWRDRLRSAVRHRHRD